MAMLNDDQPMRASLQVAPLAIHKGPGGSATDGSQRDVYNGTGDVYSQSQLTPPATPNTTYEDSTAERDNLSPPVFYNFLRAFYPFHPDYAMTDSSVTLPLNEGDVVLVHSIHTNGWADGTLLVTGARGWLPTNYCESYEPEEMRYLLKALLNFWDLLRSTCVSDREIFGNWEFLKGIKAGVRYLLVRRQGLKAPCLGQDTNSDLGAHELPDERGPSHPWEQRPAPREEVVIIRTIIPGEGWQAPTGVSPRGARA